MTGAGAGVGCGAATGDCIGMSEGLIALWAWAGAAARPAAIARMLIIDRRPAACAVEPLRMEWLLFVISFLLIGA